MATESKRYIHVVGTTTQLTTANDLMITGELWFDKTLGKFKIAPADGNYNTQSFYTHDWADISGKPSTFTPSTHTHAQSDITGLVSDLAGKAAASHSHNASAIGSGTLDPARLPLATASEFGAVKPGSGLSISSGVLSVTGGGGGGTDRGDFFDVRNYGAIPGPANAANNTAAFQAAVDAAAVQSGGWGGGTVYIPANELQDASMWDIRTPVWVHGSNIKIQGEGSQATCIRARGPAFVISRHPRFWHVWKSTYQSDGSATTGSVSGATNWINVPKCKPDLYEFRTGRAFPPTNGNPEFAPASITGTGQYFGVRTQLGVAQGRFPYAPMATGDRTQTNQTADSWPFHSKLCWEAVTYHHQTSMCGSVMGCGSVAGPGSGPDPFQLYMAAGDYYFELALTDKDMIDRTWVRWRFPMNDTIGIHRVCVQFDPDNVDVAKRLVAFVDGVQKSVTFENPQWVLGGSYVPLNTIDGSGPSTANLWTKFNRVARWNDSDFTVGSESIQTALASSDQAPYLKDYTVLAVAVHTELLYQARSAGDSQIKVGSGAPADDSTVWAHTSGNWSRTQTLGWMANEYSTSPDADTNLNVNLMARGRGGSDIWGYLCPKGLDNNWGGTRQAVNSPTIEGLRIRQYNAFPVSCGILNGPWINCYRLDDLEFDQGYYASIGAMWERVSYYGRWTNLKLGKMVHIIHQTVEGERWDWGYANVCAVRVSGSEFRLKNFSYPAPDANDEGFLTSLSAGSIGAGITLEDGTINQEGLVWAPMIAVFYVQKNFAHGNNSFRINNVTIGEVAAPVFYFDDIYWWDSRFTDVEIKNAGFSAFGPICISKGRDWKGEIEVGSTTYLARQVKSVDPISGMIFCDVKTVDRESYGLPPSGGFTKDCHEIHVRNPAPGSVAVWRAASTGDEGGSTPPTWLPVRFEETSTQHALSSNIFPGFRASCSLPWPSGGNPTNVEFTSITNQFARAALSTILTGTAAPARSHMRVKFGYLNTYTVSNGPYLLDGSFFVGATTANSGLWASATSGSKETSTTYDLTGRDPDGDPGANWSVYARYAWVFALELGDGTTMKSAFVGRTNLRDPAHWVVTSSDTAQIATAGLTIRRTDRAQGNWTHYASNRLLDWIVDGALSFGSTWHFGLSSTPISTTAGTGITEPSGGSYARVPVTMNATNWGELFDAEYIWANKTAIEFPAPTGDWGRCSWWFISDASSGGNILACGPLNRPIRVFNGDGKPTWLPGAFQVQL